MFKCEPLDPENTKFLFELFKGERNGWVQAGDKKYILPQVYMEQGKEFFQFEFKPSDVVLMSYPRSGTTWSQELVWLVANDFDFEKAKSTQLKERFPFFEDSLINHAGLLEDLMEKNKGDETKKEALQALLKPTYEIVRQMPDPRFIQTHLPLSLLPNVLKSGCKLIYVARNPKDVVVSWYHFQKAVTARGYVGDFEAFWKCFKNNLVLWSPYWEHLKEAWAQRHNPNVLFLFYEEIHQDIAGVIKRVAKFFGKSYDETQVAKLAEHLNIKNFKANPMVNLEKLVECGCFADKDLFIRRGGFGGWKEMFTPELEAEADEWIAANLKDSDIKFPLFHKQSQ